MSLSVRSLEAMDYAALDKIEAEVRALKTKRFQEAEAKARSVLDKIGQAVGAKFEFIPAQMPGNGQHKAVKAKRTFKQRSKIQVKYRDQSNPENTWSGRGRQARWITEAVKAGRAKSASDFRVAH